MLNSFHEMDQFLKKKTTTTHTLGETDHLNNHISIQGTEFLILGLQ
jgi:hypothetical protein